MLYFLSFMGIYLRSGSFIFLHFILRLQRIYSFEILRLFMLLLLLPSFYIQLYKYFLITNVRAIKMRCTLSLIVILKIYKSITSCVLALLHLIGIWFWKIVVSYKSKLIKIRKYFIGMNSFIEVRYVNTFYFMINPFVHL